MDDILKKAYEIPHAASKPLPSAEMCAFNITLEWLDGCVHHCEGCFVPRRNTIDKQQIEAMYTLLRTITNSGYGIGELMLGPTDIFSADNFYDIINEPAFLAMGTMTTFAATSTLQDDYAIIKERVQALQYYSRNWRNRGFEIFIILDLGKYMNRDIIYIEDLKRKLQLFDMDDIFFTVNVNDTDQFLNIDLAELNDRLMKEFNPPSADCSPALRINPSFLRTHKKELIIKYSRFIRDMMIDQITTETKDRIFSNMLNTNYNGVTYIDITHNDGSLYIAPFIHENIPVTDEHFKLERSGLQGIQHKVKKLFLSQHEYAKKTEQCDTCLHLANCIQRNILAYMETREITECLLPKDLFTDETPKLICST